MPTNQKKRPIRPEDFYLLKTVSDPQLSPDAKRVAYVVSWNDKDSDEMQSSVYVVAADGGAPAQRFTQGKRDSSPRWSPDGRSLAFVSKRGDDEAQLFLAPLDGGEPRQLTKAKFGASQPAWSPDGERIAYVARTGDHKPAKQRNAIERNAPRVIRNLRYRFDGIGYYDERRPHIFTVEVETGKETQITSGDYEDGQPAWSPNGKWLAFSSDRERQRFQRFWSSDIWVVPSTGGRPRKLTRSRGRAGSPAFSPDGRLIAFVGHENGVAGSSKNSHLYVVPFAGSGAQRSLSAPLDRSAYAEPGVPGGTFAWTRNGQSVLFLAEDRGAISLFRTGLANGSVSKVVGGDRQILSFALAPDGKQVYFAAIWPSEPSEIYAASLNGAARERNLSHANDELRNSVEFAPFKRMTYRAADGLAIETFILRPPLAQIGRRHPMTLLIHGGPHARHPMPTGGWLLHYQALAAAGHVVLAPNPRGSAGYGEAFSLACVRDWGGKDYEDLMTGVDVLVERGVADPDRLYVGGRSYGGFMTTWVVGHTNRFRAAVVTAPVSDLVSKFGTADIPTWYPYEIGGMPFENPDEYRFRSPTTYLPNVRTPVLLTHSEGDLRCPIGQSEEIFTTLKMLGREVEFVRYPGGFHGVRTPSQEVDQTKRVIAWFDAHAPKARAARNGRAAVTPRSGTRRNGARPARAKVTA
ncbi:MAG: S9 family peptidase [Dehalococcoidia bacterium]